MPAPPIAGIMRPTISSLRAARYIHPVPLLFVCGVGAKAFGSACFRRQAQARGPRAGPRHTEPAAVRAAAPPAFLAAASAANCSSMRRATSAGPRRLTFFIVLESRTVTSRAGSPALSTARTCSGDGPRPRAATNSTHTSWGSGGIGGSTMSATENRWHALLCSGSPSLPPSAPQSARLGARRGGGAPGGAAAPNPRRGDRAAPRRSGVACHCCAAPNPRRGDRAVYSGPPGPALHGRGGQGRRQEQSIQGPRAAP